jgi:toxin ParE1/3/4
MAKIRWSHEAEQWLKEIYEYIEQDNPAAAGKVVSGIYDKAQILMDFPELGHKYRDEPEGEIRILLYGHYLYFKGCKAGKDSTINNRISPTCIKNKSCQSVGPPDGTSMCASV